MSPPVLDPRLSPGYDLKVAHARRVVTEFHLFSHFDEAQELRGAAWRILMRDRDLRRMWKDAA